jgi:protein-tyrosine kinase
MENIRQAVERAKARSGPQTSNGLHMPPQQARYGSNDVHTQEIGLDPSYLQSQRIVAYDGKDPRSRSFDILRTEVLRLMDLKCWKTLAVTSPTPGCGKTVTATNLALSMARQSEHQVCLVDLDLQRPQVATSLGLKRREGALDVIERRIDLVSAIRIVRVGGSRLEVLPTTPSSDSSDLAASTAMKMFLQELAGYGQSRIVILDLPPILTGHDVISILPQVDCSLFVVGVGVSKISEVEECTKYLEGTDVVRIVLNKVPESKSTYAYNHQRMLPNSIT